MCFFADVHLTRHIQLMPLPRPAMDKKGVHAGGSETVLEGMGCEGFSGVMQKL